MGRPQSPWDHSKVKVYESASFTKQMEALLAETASGLNTTFRSVLDTARKRGIVTFVMGGAVREILWHNSTNFKDIDIAFACPGSELCK